MGKMSMPFGFGEKVAVLSDDLIKKSIEEQAPEHIRVYKGNSGAKDKDVLSLRLDFQSQCSTLVCVCVRVCACACACACACVCLLLVPVFLFHGSRCKD